MTVVMGDPTTLLAAFLHARIVEDEVTARNYPANPLSRLVLDECEAKRRLIADALEVDDRRHKHPITFTDGGVSHAEYMVIVNLTYPYREHPDCPIGWTD